MIWSGSLVLLAISVCLGLECQEGLLGSCDCREQGRKSSFELECPSSSQTQEQKVHIKVEPGRSVNMTCELGISWADVVNNIENLELGNVPALEMNDCPIPADSFALVLRKMGVGNLSKLKLDKMSHSNSNQLEGKHFADLEDLEEFQCNNCDIVALPGQLLNGLGKLKIISFHNNNIENIPRELFSSNKKLTNIDLSNNNITSWPGINNVFQKMTELNLAHNELTEIPKVFNYNFLKLKVLNMSHNLLGSKRSMDKDIVSNHSIGLEDLNFMQSNLKVDLSYNKIEGVELWNTNWSGWKKGFSLDLSGNPLRCDCWTSELKQKVEKKDKSFTKNTHHR